MENQVKEEASVQEFLEWFYINADFGPASEDVFYLMKREFMRQTGKTLPIGFGIEEGM